jgi:hypothetical protein
MNRTILTLALGLSALAMACDNKDDKKTEVPVVTATSSAIAPAIVTAPLMPKPVAVVDEDVETEEDFADEAEAISKTSMEAELSKIEKAFK